MMCDLISIGGRLCFIHWTNWKALLVLIWRFTG